MNRRTLEFQSKTSDKIPKSKSYFREDDCGLYSYMFIEDVSNNIVPYSEYATFGDKKYSVVLSDISIETEVKALFHVSYGFDPFTTTLSRAIFDFIRNVSSFLLLNGGKILFEVIDATVEDDESTKDIHIIKPVRGKVIRFGKNYYQIIPKQANEMLAKNIRIPDKNIWNISIPDYFGNMNDIISLSNLLKDLGKASLLGVDIVTNKQKYSGLDFNSFHSSIDSAVLQVTSKWGWDMRMSSNNQHGLEYYVYYRLLRFGHSMAVLRDDILSNMNELLKRLDYDATLSFSGIPTPCDIQNAIDELNNNNISFKKAFDIISF